MVNKYQPDVLYFDTNELPLEQAGLDAVTHYHNLSAARNGGKADVVVNGKHILPEHIGAFAEDIERSTANAICPDPWQTDTCIGDWHYRRTPPPCTPQDIRFTTKADSPYAFVGAWPESRSATVKALASNSAQPAGRKVADVSLLGYEGKLEWSQTAGGLTVTLPEKAPSEHAVTLRVKGLAA
jgi:alpha-L-fucosidase